MYKERLREPVILKTIFQAPLDLFVIMTFRTKKELTVVRTYIVNCKMPAFMILLILTRGYAKQRVMWRFDKLINNDTRELLK